MNRERERKRKYPWRILQIYVNFCKYCQIFMGCETICRERISKYLSRQ